MSPIPEPASLPPVWKLWANPIFRRYCRSRLRPRGLGVALLVTLMVAGFFFFMTRSVGIYRANLASVDAERGPLIPLLVIQSLILFVLGTAQVAGGMVAERDEGVIDYQRLVPMRPLAKVLGYLFGLPVREYVLFLATLPFTVWALWRGQVEARFWLPLYAVFFSSSLLYHLTGLVTGTVVRNRRWAFLVSIGSVFALYTVVPQMARFGLVFFKYLTITPVFEECLQGLVPMTAGAVVATARRLAPNVKFFDLDFPDSVFTIFSQSGLILTFLVMLCRRWRRAESLLLGKLWAAGFFLWIQVLLLGNALPLIDSGLLFPSRGIRRWLRDPTDFQPTSFEAVAMPGLYGLVTLGLLFILANLITPPLDMQTRGWRRARKQGKSSLAFLSDPATSFWFVAVMGAGGAGGWFVFTRALIESRWFPGHGVSLPALAVFGCVMLSAGLGFQALLEARGGRVVGLAAILVGALPLLVAAVTGAISDRLLPFAVWLGGFSPLSAPAYAAATLLSIAELPATLARAVPRAFFFWQAVTVLAALWLIGGLRVARRRRARELLGVPTPSTPTDGLSSPLPAPDSTRSAKSGSATP